MGDHHATPGHDFQNVPTLARLLAEVGDLTVGALFLLPLHHPVLLAEQVGTLWALAEGPFVLIAAAGDGAEQFAPFGVPLRQRPSRMEEHLTIVRRLLAGERLTYAGRSHRLTDVAIHPVPTEPIPIWIGASARPALQRRRPGRCLAGSARRRRRGTRLGPTGRRPFTPDAAGGARPTRRRPHGRAGRAPAAAA